MSFVKSFTHLKGRPKEEKALPLLQRIASLVKPIMRKHDWTLPLLAEFFPKSDNLVGLNVNRGQEILLRLRPPWAPDTFYDEEQLVSVMLHELTHNVHGPHDEKFYAFLSKLEAEYEGLQRSGYAGEGFHSAGSRLGVGVSHDLPPHLARLKALEAAEKRRKTASVMGSGGRLGGRSIGRNRSPRELAAEAAERRAKDEKSCGSGDATMAKIEAQRTAEDSVVDIIDVDALPDVWEGSQNTTMLEGPSKIPRKDSVGPPSKKPVPDTVVTPRLSSQSNGSEWSCPACTLINTGLVLQCAVCFTLRPGTDWTCLTCGEEGMPNDFWTCRRCGEVKTSS